MNMTVKGNANSRLLKVWSPISPDERKTNEATIIEVKKEHSERRREVAATVSKFLPFFILSAIITTKPEVVFQNRNDVKTNCTKNRTVQK